MVAEYLQFVSLLQLLYSISLEIDTMRILFSLLHFHFPLLVDVWPTEREHAIAVFARCIYTHPHPWPNPHYIYIMLLIIALFPPNIKWTASFPIITEGESTYTWSLVYIIIYTQTHTHALAIVSALVYSLLPLLLPCSGVAATSVTRLPRGARYRATYTCSSLSPGLYNYIDCILSVCSIYQHAWHANHTPSKAVPFVKHTINKHYLWNKKNKLSESEILMERGNREKTLIIEQWGVEFILCWAMTTHFCTITNRCWWKEVLMSGQRQPTDECLEGPRHLWWPRSFSRIQMMIFPFHAVSGKSSRVI